MLRSDFYQLRAGCSTHHLLGLAWLIRGFPKTLIFSNLITNAIKYSDKAEKSIEIGGLNNEQPNYVTLSEMFSAGHHNGFSCAANRNSLLGQR